MRKGFLFWFSILFIASLIAAAYFADRIAPYYPNQENRQQALHPPTWPHFRDANGHFHLRPYIYPTHVIFEANMTRDYAVIAKKKCFLRRAHHRLFSVQAPAKLYLMGTDSRGRDIFSRILYGARTSLSIGLLGALVAVAFGFLVGAVAGYYGGWLDHVLMRFAEFFIMIPALYLLLALRAALQQAQAEAQAAAADLIRSATLSTATTWPIGAALPVWSGGWCFRCATANSYWQHRPWAEVPRRFCCVIFFRIP